MHRRGPALPHAEARREADAPSPRAPRGLRLYSSLDKIDLLADEPGGVLVAQTDHRRRDEIEAEPEVSTLFALIRVLCPRQVMEREGRKVADIVYVAFDEPPPFLTDALASVGAVLEVIPDKQRRRLPPAEETTEQIADRAFAGLARRVCRRVGITDPAAALRVLEGESLADPVERDDDEIAYWTRVLELTAMVVAVIRARHPGQWVITDKADVPFGFSLGDGQLVLPGNRAQRFLEDGENESMFLLVGSTDEIAARNASGAPEGPLLPSLRSKKEAEASSLLWRPLLRGEHDDVPVIAYGADGDQTFGLLQRPKHEPRAEEVHAKAMANVRGQDVDVQELEVGELEVLAVSGSFFATEKLLDPVFMKELHERLGAPLLAVGVPRRGLMFVASAVQEPQRIGILAAMIGHEHEKGGSRAISSAVILVSDGEPTGIALPYPSRPLLDDAAPRRDTAPEQKKPGFFRRLFGKK